MRLIDADELYKKFIDGKSDTPKEKDANQIARYIIRHSPTIEAEKVVRCKECAYWNRSSEIMPDGEQADYGWCGKLLDADSETEVVTSEMDYCSFGDRKD